MSEGTQLSISRSLERSKNDCLVSSVVQVERQDKLCPRKRRCVGVEGSGDQDLGVLI